MAYPSNQIRIRDGKVTPIVIPDHQLAELKKVLESKTNSSWRKDAMIKQVIGGNCCICREIPSMQVVYSLEGATRIERYCDRCIKNVFAREAVL
jgi:hypothetical protein